MLPGLIDRMSGREKAVTGAAAVVILLTMAWGLLLSPLADKADNMRRRAARVEEKYNRFQSAHRHYLDLKASMADIEGRLAAGDSDTSLLARVEGGARRLGLSEKITSMKPFTSELDSGIVESAVEIRLEKMDLGGLVRFLEEVEKNGSGTRAGRIRIKSRFDDPQLMDVTVRVSVLEAG